VADSLTTGSTPTVPPTGTAAHPMLAGRYELLRFGPGVGGDRAGELVPGRDGSRWYAIDHLLGLRVRITELPIMNPDRRTADRWRDEVRRAASFAHPNAVGVFDLVLEAGRAYLIEEYVRGQTLTDQLARGSPGPTAAERIVREIADALAAARSHDVVLGEVSADTVLVTRSGAARLDAFASALVRERPSDDAAALGDLAAALGVGRGVARSEFPITDRWLSAAAKASPSSHDPGRTRPRNRPRNRRSIVGRRWTAAVAGVVGLLTVAALVAVLTREPNNPVAGARRSSASTAVTSKIPLTPTSGGCMTLVGSIIWTWRAPSGGPPVVSYEVDEDASGIRYPITEPRWRSFHADADVHVIAVFAVGKDGRQSQTPLEISCRAGSIEHYGYFTDASGDATLNVAGTADMTALNWTWGSLGLQLLVTFTANTDLRKVAVGFYFDTDRNPGTGYSGMGCGHADASMIGVERVFIANDVSVLGGTVGPDCQLRPIATSASVVADHAIEVTIPRSEFAGQTGEVGVKVGAAVVTGWKDALAVAAQDVLSDIGQAPVKVYCQP
jgi:hypothetical protein